MNKRTELLGEAYRCGEFAGQIFQDGAENGVSLRRLYYVDAAYDRAQELGDLLGPEAMDAFGDGLDAILPAIPERTP